MERWLRKVVGMAIVMVFSIAIQSHGAETPEQFYKGKTISIFTGSAGGNADIVSRVLAPFLEKETGATVIVRNLPGGGVLQTENLAFKAKPDGLTLLNMEPSAVALSTWFNEQGAVFDVAKFSWLAQLAFEPSLFAASPVKSYNSIKDLQQAKKLKFGTSTPLSWFGLVNMMLSDILNLDAKVISGFKGAGPMNLSIQKGELDGGVVSESMAKRQSAAGQVKPLFLFYGASKLFPNLPQLTKEVKLKKEQEMLLEILAPPSKAIATSPDVPRERVEFLRKVFIKLSEDKNCQKALVEKGDFGDWYGFVPGGDLQKQLSQPNIGQDVKRLVENRMERYLER